MKEVKETECESSFWTDKGSRKPLIAKELDTTSDAIFNVTTSTESDVDGVNAGDVENSHAIVSIAWY